MSDMNDRLRFHPKVVGDLRKATSWYDKISVALGNQFRTAVESRLDAIAENPFGFARAFGNVSFTRLKRFPYLVLFETTDGAVLIAGVFHSSSDPKKWRKRIERK